MSVTLLQVFHSFATFGDRLADGTTMDSSRFAKLTRDTRILDGLLTPTDVDLIFTRVKPRNERKIRFPEFKNAIDEMARVKYGNDPDGPVRLREAIVEAGGPLLDAVHLPVVGGVFDKLTSPKLYTGAHRERFAEDGRGRGKEGRTDTVNPRELSELLRPSQQRGGTHLSSAHAERVRLIDGGSLSPSRLGYVSRAVAVESSRVLGSTNLPSPGAGVEDEGGAAARGGASVSTSPSRGGGAGGMGFTGSAATLQKILSAMPTYTETVGSAGGSAAGSAATSAAVASRHGPRVVIDSPELRGVFNAYAAFGTTHRLADELDSFRFAKLCRESGLMDGVLVTPAAVDLAFTLAKKHGSRVVTYADFQQALASLAPQCHPELDIVAALKLVVECIIAGGGPAVTGVSVPDVAPSSVFAKLTDTTLYTGAHKQRFDRQGNGKGLEGRVD